MGTVMSTATTTKPTGQAATEDLDVIIVGAGFAGLYLLDRLRRLDMTVQVLEAGGGLGGVWYWNCYPGARVDSPGPIYQYSRDDVWRKGARRLDPQNLRACPPARVRSLGNFGLLPKDRRAGTIDRRRLLESVLAPILARIDFGTRSRPPWHGMAWHGIARCLPYPPACNWNPKAGLRMPGGAPEFPLAICHCETVISA
jgi:hypothetical protein